MFIEARIGFRRGRLHWYDFVFLAFAAVIIYPDEILDWIGAHTGWSFNWKHVVLLEVFALGALAGFVSLLMPHYPRVHWWAPLPFIAAVALFRGIMEVISRSLGD